MKIKRLPDWLQSIIDMLSVPLGWIAGFIGFKKCDYCKKWVWLNVDVKELYIGHETFVNVCEHCVEKEN